MGLMEKAADFCKTSMGKFLLALLAVVLVLVFSNLAYGTGEEDDLPLSDTGGAAEVVDPAGDGEEAAVPEDEDPLDNGQGDEDAIVADTEDQDEDGAQDGEGAEGTEEEEAEEAQPVEPGKARIVFKDIADSHLSILEGVESSIEVPEGEALTFTLVPDAGYRVKAARIVTTIQPEAAPAALADEPTEEGQEPEDEPSQKTVTDEQDLDLKDSADKELAEKNPDARSIMLPEDSVQGLVEVYVETEERDMIWNDIVLAFEAGEDVALANDVQFTKEDSQAVVSGSAVELQLNGHKIKNATDVDVDAFFVVRDGGSLTISDANEGVSRWAGNSVAADSSMAGAEGAYADGVVEFYETMTTATDRYDATTTEKQVKHTITIPDTVGAIEGTGNVASLFSVYGGTLNVQGGRLTNAGSSEGHGRAIEAVGSTVCVTDGFIVGNTLVGGNGAGIHADSATVVLNGSAVVAGNSVQFTGEQGTGNGGGIWAASTDLTISDDAVVAANKATENSNGTEAWGTKGDRPVNQLGGGLYLTNTDATVEGNALIASNAAQYEGGGIYCAAGTDQLALAAGTNVTNNKTLVSPVKVTDKESIKENWAIIGGGGISSSGTVNIAGGCMNGNRSADAGGALLMPLLNGKVTATLKMSDGVVACNVAEADEGGGMYLFTTGNEDGEEKSFINAGFITNNDTQTSFGYGGGGLFIANASPLHGYVNVVNPLIVDNRAEGQGGGIAGCKNGVMITNDAAIFDNYAEESTSTSHESGLGDNWGKQISQELNEGASDEDRVHYSNDYFNARESTVYANMLGGGAANWTGYMNYGLPVLKVTQGSAWNSAKTLTVNGSEVFAGKVSGIANNQEKLLGSAIPNGVVRVSLKDVSEEEVKAFIATLEPGVLMDAHRDGTATVTTIDEQGYAVIDTDLQVDEAGRDVVNGYSTEVDSGVTYYHIFFKYWSYVDSMTQPDHGYIADADDERTNEGIEFGTLAYLTETVWGTTNTTSTEHYIVKLKPNEFPKETATNPAEAQARAYADRIMALTAHPSDEAVAAARSAAVLVISNNHSNTNGGGIACNGFAHIGAKMPDVPDPEDPKDPAPANLVIKKSFPEGFDANAGTATVVFNVTGYISKDWDRTDPVYENTISMTFDPTADPSMSQSYVIEGLDSSYYFIVEEVAFTGNNYTSGQARWEGYLKDGTLKDGIYQVIAPFVNTFHDDDTFGTGAVNRYTKQDGTYAYEAQVDTKTWTPAASQEQ